MNQNKQEKKLNLDFFEKSYLLDRDILISLSSILIKGVLNKSDNFEKKINSCNFKIENKENLTNEDIPNLIKTFNLVNEERKNFRSIIKKMLKNKFWLTIKNEKKNENFFINKIKGLNLEILKTKIDKLEKREKTLLQNEKNKNIQIEDLKKIKIDLEKQIEISKQELKKTLMCDKSKSKINKKNEEAINLKLNFKDIRSKRLKTENSHVRRFSKGVKTSRKISLRKSKKERSSCKGNGELDLLKKSEAFDYYGKYDGKSSYESTFLF